MRLTRESGFTDDAAHELIDVLFRELTVPKLWKLLKAELGDPLVLDGFRKNPLTGDWHHAEGPALLTHIFSANVPSPAIVSFVLGMLVKSRNVGKVSSKDRGFLDIYLASLKRVNPALAARSRLLRSHDRRALRRCLERSDLVVVYGDDRTLSTIRNSVPPKTRFIGYGHRVSLGVCLREVLKKRNLDELARRVARDLWTMDQRGCLSPSVIYLEKGGEISPLAFSREVAKRLSTHGRWMTLYDGKVSAFPKPASNRIIYFKAFENMGQVYEALKPIRLSLQSVALEGDSKRRRMVTQQLASLGVNRICRAGRMQNPPITWHHDGMPNLASWVRWTDRED